jgi:hypothetical protein
MGAFWAICLIELCIGVYFPSMELLKSEVIEDGVRGTAYSVMRVPLNVFVVAAHAMDQEGEQASIFSYFSISCCPSCEARCADYAYRR